MAWAWIRIVSAVFVCGFGDADGIPDRERHDHADHGDFSFVWTDIPVVVHDGYSPAGSSESLMNSAAWRHSIVTYDGAGNSPVVPVSTIPKLPAVTDTAGYMGVADMYTDGISEALNPRDVLYGHDRIREAMAQGPADAVDLGQSLLADVRRFTRNRKQSDDICLLCLARVVGRSS